MEDNGPQITKAIRSVLKDDYNYDSTVCNFSSEPRGRAIDVLLFASLRSMPCGAHSRNACSSRKKGVSFSTRTNTEKLHGRFRKKSCRKSSRMDGIRRNRINWTAKCRFTSSEMHGNHRDFVTQDTL